MKKFKKFFAVILSLAMVLGMSLTAFAADGSSNDNATVTITGLEGNPKVTLYRIAAGNYQGTGKNAFVDYTWAENVPATTVAALKKGQSVSSTDINAIAKLIKANSLGSIKDLDNNVITDTGIVSETQATNKEYTATVKAGAYIALIESSVVIENGERTTYVYNPILLTASYGENGFVGGSINAETALYGTDSVAKRSKATIKKELAADTPTDPEIPDNANDEGDKYTASVGDVLDYKITPTIPTYPANAENKTLFVQDKMSDGLTFDASSLTINVNGKKVTATNGTLFIYEEKTIATVDTTTITNGFYLDFDYDKIVNAQRVPYDITVTYSARVNENAVVGKDGNNNEAKMYYANDPNSGSTFHPGPGKNPDEATGVTKEEDKKTVYTYQVAFEKVDDDKKPLAGAKFGIYTNAECTKLFDIVVTNAAGVAVSTSIEAGNYWIREIEAPDGYSLNDEIFPIIVNWKNATGSITRTTISSSETKYTTNPEEAATLPAVQVGWILGRKFYADKPEGATDDDRAYVKMMTTTSETTETVEPGEAGSGTVIELQGDRAIKNTKLTALPSTGGIGTTIFTIGGCIIMVAAAALFFASRRKSAK